MTANRLNKKTSSATGCDSDDETRQIQSTEAHTIIGRDERSYLIRVSDEADWPEIKRLFAVADAFHAERRPDMYRVREGEARSDEFLRDIHDDPRQMMWVAEADDGTIISYIHNRMHSAGAFPAAVPREIGSLQTMAVDERYRDAGVGRYLIELAMDWAEENGAVEHWLEVQELNDLGRELYKRMGFVTYSQKMNLTKETRATTERNKRRKPQAARIA